MDIYISCETALMLLAVAHVASVMLLLAISQAAMGDKPCQGLTQLLKNSATKNHPNYYSNKYL